MMTEPTSQPMKLRLAQAFRRTIHPAFLHACSIRIKRPAWGFWYILPWLGCALSAYAQAPEATSGIRRMQTYAERTHALSHSWVRDIPFEQVGPTVFSGRVSDLAVNPERPEEFLVAYASGGLWHTRTNGSTMVPLFDQEAVITLGAIAVDWKKGVIWAGTGEVNASRSSYAGTGVYRSTDFGKTWTWCGLPESHHIGRIVLHPGNADIAWVAVMGHLYTPNPERGVYMTRDGGQNWAHVLAVNEHTGAIDLVADPLNPEVIYAATWERSRQAWHFQGSGAGSAIYKSDDGGQTWAALSGEGTGFPSGPELGRIGLAAAIRGDQTVLYALVDNQGHRPPSSEESAEKGITRAHLSTMSREAFLKLSEAALQDYLRRHGVPKRYTPALLQEMVRKGELEPATLAAYLEDANAALFQTPVIGAELYRLEAHGNWAKTHESYLDDLYYSYGYYFGQVRVQPDDPDHLYLLGVPVLRSADGGKTFHSVNGDNVHVDHHALWINPLQPGHLLLGNDGGLNLSYDFGESWVRLNRPPVGQFYTVTLDMEEPFNIYGGLQDNGVWKGPSTYRGGHGWEMSGRYPYQSLIGGDGMQVQVDPREQSRRIYTGYQFGNYFRIDTQNGERTPITPKPQLGEASYRWNWQTPIHLSVHHPDILYMGCQKFLRSLNRGDQFQAISEDLTKGGQKGNVPFGTLTTIHESPRTFGLLYAGSDDGLAWVSQDGGHQWRNINEGLPADLWVTRIQASAHVASRVYISLNGYRQDHFEAYIYRSDDYGANWVRLGADLPTEPVNVIKEDPLHPWLIYVGTDGGAYASLDEGGHFMPFHQGLPVVPVHDLAAHPRDHKLVLGTHGRSFYMADIEVLRRCTPELRQQDLHLFEKEPVKHSLQWGHRNYTWAPTRSPSLLLWYFSRHAGEGHWKIRPVNRKVTLAEGAINSGEGLQYWEYDLRISREGALGEWRNQEKQNASWAAPVAAPDGTTYLPKGEYDLILELGQQTKSIRLRIE